VNAVEIEEAISALRKLRAGWTGEDRLELESHVCSPTAAWARRKQGMFGRKFKL
jgi:hypothetical protein